MIKNHTHNNDSGGIHYIFKKILDLGIIKEAFTIIPLFFKSYAFPYKLCNTDWYVDLLWGGLTACATALGDCHVRRDITFCHTRWPISSLWCMAREERQKLI